MCDLSYLNNKSNIDEFLLSKSTLPIFIKFNSMLSFLKSSLSKSKLNFNSIPPLITFASTTICPLVHVARMRLSTPYFVATPSSQPVKPVVYNCLSAGLKAALCIPASI